MSEPRHYEHTVVYLLLGDDHAVLIDTGCGIGNISAVVDQITTLPVTVINTHTHLDHLGGNHGFSHIMIYDHPRSRHLSKDGAKREDLMRELHDGGLVTPPWPKNYDRTGVAIPPFQVSRWLHHGDVIRLGGIELEVLHTPGEAPDHISLLDKKHHMLFCGDILLAGNVWSHLDGGDLGELLQSYDQLYRRFDEFDRLMPSHNQPNQSKELLPIALAGARDILSGKSKPTSGSDFWGRPYERYDFGPIGILKRP